MVIEKLKEWEDKKDEREDQQILWTIDKEIQDLMKEKNELEKRFDDINIKLIDLFDQYLMIK